MSKFFTWFGGNLTLPLLLLGFWPIYFGLSLPQALLAIAAGTAAGALLMGVLAAMGTRLGLPQQVQARGPLGYYGNYPPVAIVNVFAAVGWAVVNTIIGAQALDELLGVPSSAGIVAISVLQGLLVVFGYNMIHFVNRIGSVLLGVLFLSITVVALTKAHWTTHSDPHAPFFVGTTGGWITSAGYFFSFLLAWAPFASDYSRYLPASTSGRRVRLNTAAGNFCAIFWLGAVGALVASAAGQAGVIESVKHLTGDFAPLAMLTIVVSTFPVNGLNLYGGAISLLTLRAPVSRRTAAVIATVLTMVLSLWLGGDIYAKFHDFLVASGYLIAPWVTVVFLDLRGVPAVLDVQRLDRPDRPRPPGPRRRVLLHRRCRSRRGLPAHLPAVAALRIPAPARPPRRAPGTGRALRVGSLVDPDRLAARAPSGAEPTTSAITRSLHPWRFSAREVRGAAGRGPLRRAGQLDGDGAGGGRCGGCGDDSSPAPGGGVALAATSYNL
ncbi:purine-cytosine permease family protein [Spirillospora sp. CA-142024]|uniref:purine-cytosine permease family protein n=1 Tax=Spirillospora sp. CA-142024 TaxID=3240036 RepID=UPI003D8C3AAA